MRILIALSGGIDSSVLAHILKNQGHDIVGIRLLLWNDPLAPPFANLLQNKCCDAQSEARAKYVAGQLDIPFHNIDLKDAFKREVVDPFLEGCRRGITPNPCVRCNRTLKFGVLCKLLDEFKCEKLATGHYARVAVEKLPDGSKRYLLLEAVDNEKDQSYFLYGLTQKELKRVLFPLGPMHKKDVYALAKHFSVPIDETSYRESQNLCFFPEKEPTQFLRRHLRGLLMPGEIVRRDGTVIGEHKGLPLYTIGQRRIGVGGLKTPLEVVEKDIKNNRLIVGECGCEKVNKIFVQDLSFISWAPTENEPTQFDCRTRSLSPRKNGTFTLSGSSGTFDFDEPQAPPAPGQSLVLYRGEEVVGGGIMK